ncbi:MAG: type II toxin-antitoxin system VapC family toxin [Alphaproteobacteria bacterium]
MRVLLDTHALLWWLAAAPDLSDNARRTIADPENEVLVSICSIWEVAIKARLGRLDMPDDLEGFFADQLPLNGFTVLPIHLHHAARVRHLADHHRDPFDRLLVAQAQCEAVSLVSRDQWLSAYDVETIW